MKVFKEKKRRSLFSNVKIEVTGLNHARLLEKLRKIATLKDIKSESKTVSFWCAKKDESKIIALLNELCYNYVILERTGFAHNLTRIFARAGIFLGIIISLFLIAVYPRIVLSVSVNDPAYKEQAIKVLSDFGVKQFDFVWKVDLEGISNKLASLEGVSYAKATRQGTALYIEIQSELEPPEFLFESGHTVVSKRVATVTRVVVYSGTATVKYGDIVRVGDVLIDGYFTVREQRIDTTASGEVFGKVYAQKTYFFEKADWEGKIAMKEQQERTAQLLMESTLTHGEVVTQKWFEHTENEIGYFVKVRLECEVKIN